MRIKEKIFFLVLAAPVVYLCSCAILAAGQENNPSAADTKALEQGKAIYVRECSSCHGLQGKGDGPAAIALTPKPRNLAKVTADQNKTDDQFFQQISGGRSPMPAYKSVLSDTQIRQVIAYIRSFGASAKGNGGRP